MKYQDVVRLIGGGVMREAARRLGISPNTVYGWSRKGLVPVRRHEQVRAVAAAMGIEL
jgi:transposase-like protein